MDKQNFVAFIAVTGRPTQEQIDKMMKGYKDVGINDVMMYPRTGLAIDYMSEDWHKYYEYCLNTAKKYGMRLWLYDEMNWPSGTCNHQVYFEDNHFYAKNFYVENGEVHIYQYGFDFDKNEWPFAGIENVLGKYYDKHEDRFFRREYDIKTGKEIAFLHENEFSDKDLKGKNRHGGIVDLFNPEATKCFIKLTHERYYNWFKEDFGTTIPGIFTDEPSFSHGGNPFEPRPNFYYYDGIIEDYKNAYGTNIIDDMLAYVNHMNDNNFKANHHDLITKRFAKSFLGVINDWCINHGIVFTGHMVKDDSVTDSVYATGNVLETLKEFESPGIDDIYTRMSLNESFLGLPASTGATTDFLYSQLENMRRNGKKRTMVELFGLGPYNMSMAQRIRGIYYSASFGINDFFMGLGHIEAMGNYGRGEWFVNSGYACPDHDAYKTLTAEAPKALAFAEKIPCATISLRYPYTASLQNMGKADTVDYDFLMKDAIQLLACNQIQWRMIGDSEQAKTQEVVGFYKNGVVNEKTGKVYKTAAAWWADVKDSLKRNIEVTEMSGALANNVYVKEFTDGTYMVLNRADDPGTARRVVVNAFGKKTIIDLYDYCVYTGEAQEQIDQTLELIPENVHIDMYGKKPYFRCDFFGNHSYSFETDCDITVKMHICTYPEKRDVFLDDELLAYGEKETDFTDCFNNLYQVSKPILLKRGKHVLSLHDFDRPFLPMIIFEGDIAKYTDYDNDGVAYEVFTKDTSAPSPHKGKAFFKNAGLKFTVDVPTGAGAKVAIDDFLGYCKFKINGETVCEKARAPYFFTIDKKFGGKKAECEIEYFSTYQELFGDVDHYEEKLRLRSDWVRVSPTSGRKETVGMNGLRIFAEVKK